MIVDVTIYENHPKDLPTVLTGVKDLDCGDYNSAVSRLDVWLKRYISLRLQGRDVTLNIHDAFGPLSVSDSEQLDLFSNQIF